MSRMWTLKVSIHIWCDKFDIFYTIEIWKRNLISLSKCLIGSEKAAGIPQQLGIFYAMGLALMSQSLFSVCYHTCPTNLSLQFDTTMMYVICILCYVKIYQFRHPDTTANAFSIFALLGVLILIEAVVLNVNSWLTFTSFLVFYLSMIIFISFDTYYNVIGRIDSTIAKLLIKGKSCHKTQP